MPEYTPAPAKPENGPFTDLAQKSPMGLLPAEARAQVAHFAESAPNWAGTVLLPGALTHWVQLSAREIVSFQSFLTGRLAQIFGATRTASSVAVSDTLAQPERLATQLRSAELSHDSAALLGHLLGAELAATRAYWLGVDIRILGDDPLSDAYEAALEAQAAFVAKS